MDDLEYQTCNTGYTSYEDISSNPRHQPYSQLEQDLINTANGTRGTRQATRKKQVYQVNPDSDEGSDSTIDEDYDVDSILSSIEEGLT